MTRREYSEAELNQISAQIMADSKRLNDATTEFGGGKTVLDDWDDDLFISEDMYEQYMAAVQQDKSDKYTKEAFDRNTTFEEYLRHALSALEYRREGLTRELESGTIDLRIYNNGKMLRELAVSAIRKFLEKGETARLIGV